MQKPTSAEANRAAYRKLDEQAREWVDERAAIRWADGGYEIEDAYRLAMSDWRVYSSSTKRTDF